MKVYKYLCSHCANSLQKLMDLVNMIEVVFSFHDSNPRPPESKSMNETIRRTRNSRIYTNQKVLSLNQIKKIALH
jgi:hypothetical protein